MANLNFLPIVVYIFTRINRHYKDIAEQLSTTKIVQDMPVVDKNLAIVPC